MTTLQFMTQINAPIHAVFDLSRSVDVHLESTSQTHEKAIGGRTSGLLGLNETVTWQAKHFGILLCHESEITAMDAPGYFVDEMRSGKFRSFRHEHYFEERDGTTFMTDNIHYEVPYGILGVLFNIALLKRHLRDLIAKRNAVIKHLAEKNYRQRANNSPSS